MTITYASNRPSIVSNALRAVGDGVATITATASYHGVSKSQDFVVRVVGALDDVRVNGKSLGAFTPEQHDYDIVVPAAAVNPPVVSASAGVVTQATGIPGSATIVVTGDDGVAQTYTVHFARPAVGDEFDGGAPGPQWPWVRHTANGGAGSPAGALRITTEPGDLLSTPTTTTNTAKNLLVQPAGGDWTIESRLDLGPRLKPANQSAGIIAYQGDDDYLRFGIEYGGTPAGVQLSVTSEDWRSCCARGYAQAGGPVSQTLTTARPAGIGSATRSLAADAEVGGRYRMWYSVDGSRSPRSTRRALRSRTSRSACSRSTAPARRVAGRLRLPAGRWARRPPLPPGATETPERSAATSRRRSR